MGTAFTFASCPQGGIAFLTHDLSASSQMAVENLRWTSCWLLPGNCCICKGFLRWAEARDPKRPHPHTGWERGRGPHSSREPHTPWPVSRRHLFGAGKVSEEKEAQRKKENHKMFLVSIFNFCWLLLKWRKNCFQLSELGWRNEVWSSPMRQPFTEHPECARLVLCEMSVCQQCYLILQQR